MHSLAHSGVFAHGAVHLALGGLEVHIGSHIFIFRAVLLEHYKYYRSNSTCLVGLCVSLWWIKYAKKKSIIFYSLMVHYFADIFDSVLIKLY